MNVLEQMGIRFPPRGEKSARPVLPPKKAHSTVMDCRSCSVPRKPSNPAVPFCKWRGRTQKENGTWISSGTDRMLALHGGENIHRLPDTVLSLSSNPIFHLFRKYFWSTCCVLVHPGAGEYVLFLCWSSVPFIITVSVSSQGACLIAAGPEGQEHTERPKLFHDQSQQPQNPC